MTTVIDRSLGSLPLQGELSLARVKGELVATPQDLYIPPEALEVFLDAFEGPLDLLLYLIKRSNIDILDIPVAEITHQYMGYIELMQESRFALAAEYLVMAATLAEIKSRLLLPRPSTMDDEVDDPRAELIRRLQDYERFKQAAESLDELPRLEREHWQAGAALPRLPEAAQAEPEVALDQLLRALSGVLKRAECFTHHQISPERLSTRQRMTELLEALRGGGFCDFVSLFSPEEGRQGVVITFLALMELIKEALVELVQHEPFGQIHVKARLQS